MTALSLIQATVEPGHRWSIEDMYSLASGLGVLSFYARGTKFSNEEDHENNPLEYMDTTWANSLYLDEDDSLVLKTFDGSQSHEHTLCDAREVLSHFRGPLTKHNLLSGWKSLAEKFDHKFVD